MKKDQYFVPRCRLELYVYKISFVPDAAKHWDLLNAETKEAMSVNSFPKNIITKVTTPSPWLSFVKQHANIFYTQLFT